MTWHLNYFLFNLGLYKPLFKSVISLPHVNFSLSVKTLNIFYHLKLKRGPNRTKFPLIKNLISSDQSYGISLYLPTLKRKFQKHMGIGKSEIDVYFPQRLNKSINL